YAGRPTRRVPGQGLRSSSRNKMSLEGNDPVIGHGGRVSLGRNQGGQPVTNGQKDLWGKGSASPDFHVIVWSRATRTVILRAASFAAGRTSPGPSRKIPQLLASRDLPFRTECAERGISLPLGRRQRTRH